MLSPAVSHRVGSGRLTFSQRAVSHPRLVQRKVSYKVKCFYEASQVQEAPVQEPLTASLEEPRVEPQEVVTEQVGEETISQLSSLFKDNNYPQKFLDTLKEYQYQMDPDCIKVASGTLRKITADYSSAERKTEQVNVPLETIKESYRILTRVISENLNSIDFFGVSNCVWCLILGKESLSLQEEIENYEQTLEDLFALSARLVAEAPIRKLSLVKLTRVAYLVANNLNVNNRKHFDVLYQKLLSVPPNRYQLRDFFDLIRVFNRIECTDLEVLDAYIQHMRDKYLTRQLFIMVFCSHAAQLRYYDQEIVSKLSKYLQSDRKFTNGASLVSIAEYVAALAQHSDGREQLAQTIALKAIQDFEEFRISDIVEILYYTANTHCPEEEYLQLVNQFVKMAGDNFGQFSDVLLRMLRQAQLQQSSQGVVVKFPQELSTMCVNAQSVYIDAVVNAIRQNDHLLDIYQTIYQQYQDAQCGVTVLDGEVAIPILVENGEQKVVVQPVSEKDFVLNVPGRLLESKKAEYGILENLGYQVQEVVSQKWYEEDGYKSQVLNELSQRLDGVFVEVQTV